MDYNFNLFPGNFVGWVYFLAALILVALVVFIGRRVRRGRKSSRQTPDPVALDKEGEEGMPETNTQSAAGKPLPPMFIWFAVCAMSFGLIFWASVVMKFVTAVAMIALAGAVLYFAVKFSNQGKYKTAAIVLLIEVVLGFAGYFTGTLDFIFATTNDWSLNLRIVSVFIFVISAGVLYANWQGWTTKRVVKTIKKTAASLNEKKTRDLWSQLSASEQKKVRMKLGKGKHDQSRWREVIIEVMEEDL